MKAERRHELQTNTLALWLRWRAPQLLEQYGTRILLGVIVLALAIVLIRYRINAPKVAAAEATIKLEQARQLIAELKAGALPGQVSQALQLIMEALDRSDNPVIHAEGYLTLGDYYWNLASYPEMPEVPGQPGQKPDLPHDELLAKAEDGYKKALAAQTERAHLVATAQLGLAVVAEQLAFEMDRKATGAATRRNDHWALAKEHYQAVVNLPGVAQVQKDLAQWHIGQLAQLQEPVWLVPPEPMVPATQTSSTQAATQPMVSASSVPATMSTSNTPATQPAR